MAGVAILLAACTKHEGKQDEPRAHEVTWQSEHFVVHARSDDKSWCQGVLGTLEHHFAVMQDTLGFAWPEGARVQYHKFENQLQLRAAGVCSRNNDACFFADKGVYTTAPLELHELLHAYLAPLGNSHPVLEEGIAEALSCVGQPQSAAKPVPLAEAFSVDAWSSPNRAERRSLYRAAAWFVGEQFRRLGKERFLQLYTSLRRGQDLARVRAVFSRVAGEELDAAWQRALSNPDPDGACIRAWECAAPDASHSLERPWFQRCEQDDHGFTFTLDTPTWVKQQAPGRGALLGSCGPRPTPHAARINRALGGNDAELFWLALGPGKYFVQKRDAATRLQLAARPLAQSLGADCRSLDPLPASFVLGYEIAFGEGQLGPSPLWLVLRDTDPEAVPRYSVECSAGVVVRGCASCDESSCQSLCGGETPPTLVTDGRLLLNVQSTTAGAATIALGRVHRPVNAGR